MLHRDKHETHLRLVARLRQRADDVRRFTEGLDSDLAKRAKPPEWSLKSACHCIIRTQKAHRRHVGLESGRVRMPDGDAELKDGGAAGAGCMAAFSGSGTLRRAPEELPAQWHRAGRHPDSRNSMCTSGGMHAPRGPSRVSDFAAARAIRKLPH
jgi:hypothetical protein